MEKTCDFGQNAITFTITLKSRNHANHKITNGPITITPKSQQSPKIECYSHKMWFCCDWKFWITITPKSRQNHAKITKSRNHISFFSFKKKTLKNLFDLIAKHNWPFLTRTRESTFYLAGIMVVLIIKEQFFHPSKFKNCFGRSIERVKRIKKWGFQWILDDCRL